MYYQITHISYKKMILLVSDWNIIWNYAEKIQYSYVHVQFWFLQ